ncbi:MAG: selenocysteine-specific translation elongation factor [Thermoguttaceae bacterium]
MQQVNITLGTAGHIDHGKTALVKCLTGCETDRLKEEKERGMSIELGFAPCKIGDTQVGIVDVPGHENFIKTMVAGASGMDGVILVVAADDGVMPQTREHLDILTLLGVRHGIVALTKIDRIAAEDRPGVQAAVAAFLRGTFLEGAPICPLSNVSGEGFDPFLEALWALVAAIEPRRTDGVFRLPLERAFSVQGYGTVAAGIPVAGAAHAGDEIVLLPEGLAGRIRRIEVYGQTSETVMAGQCAALNVGHWDHREIRRGDVLTIPGFFSPKQWYLCSLRLLPREKLLLKSGAEVRFHTGTSDVAASFYPLSGTSMEGGQSGLIQVKTKTPVVAGPGDHFLLRTASPVRTIGGGRIVEAIERRLKANRPELREDLQQRAEAILDPRRFVEYCVRRAEGLATSEASVAVRTKIPHARVQEILADLAGQKVIFALTAKDYVHRDTAAAAGEKILGLVADFHRQSPESPGLPPEQLRRDFCGAAVPAAPAGETPAPQANYRPLRQAMPIDKAVLDALVARLKDEKRLVEKNGRLALPEHRSTFGGEEAKLLETIETLFREKLFSPPDAAEVATRTNVPAAKVAKLLGLLREHGRLLQVDAAGMLFHSDAIARAREILAEHFRKEARLESVQFKYLLDTTRKFALPMLDYMDRVGVTRRVGNTRFPKNPPPSS